MSLVAGIDSGGTRTRLIVSSVETDAAASEAPSHLRLEATHAGDGTADAGAMSSANRLIREALGRLGASPPDVVAVVVGCSGGGLPSVRAEWSATMRRAIPRASVKITGDDRLLLPALGATHGITIIAGTGAAVSVVTADGRRVSADGWGPLFGDGGGGFDLGRRAVAAALAALDRDAKPTPLARSLAKSLGLPSLVAAGGIAHDGHIHVTSVAALAPLVIDAAVGGDAIAEGVVSSGVSHLAGSVAAALTRSDGVTTSPIALAGGLLVGSAWYRKRLIAELVRLDIGLEVPNISLIRDPVVGALALARTLAGAGSQRALGENR